MTIYYLLPIFLFLQSRIVSMFSGSEKRKRNIIIFCAVTIILFSSIRALEVGSDTQTYVRAYQRMPSISFEAIIKRQVLTVFEPGYLIICKLFSYISTTDFFFKFWTSALSVIPIAIFVNKFSAYPTLSFALYCMSNQLLFEMCIIRQSLSMGIVALAYVVIINRKQRWILKALILILVACTIHTSGIVGIALIPMALIKKIDAKYYLVSLISILLICLLGSRVVNFFFYGSEYIVSGGGIGRIVISLGIIAVINSYKNILEVYDENAIIWEQCAIISLLMQVMSYFFIMTTRTALFFTITYIVSIPNILAPLKRSQKMILGSIVFSLYMILFWYSFDNQYIYSVGSNLFSF